jgi:transcriptional regulator with XRE-family HTH domain
VNVGRIIADLRDKRGWSQADLARHSGVSRVMIGKYEREKAIPSIDAAKKIADAMEVTLDNLVGEGIGNNFDKRTLQRIQEIQQLDEAKRNVLFDLIDTYIRDAKVRNAHK